MNKTSKNQAAEKLLIYMPLIEQIDEYYNSLKPKNDKCESVEEVSNFYKKEWIDDNWKSLCTTMFETFLNATESECAENEEEHYQQKTTMRRRRPKGWRPRLKIKTV